MLKRPIDPNATAWLLTRTSTEKQQTDGAGPDAQLAAIRLQAQAAGFPATRCRPMHENWTGYAESLAERPELLSILQSAQPGDVVFWDQSDRAARDTMARDQIVQFMRAKGLRWWSDGREYDLASLDDLLVLGIRGVLDQYTGRALVARMNKGRQAMRHRGVVVEAKCPFGYRYLAGKNHADRAYLVVDSEAAVVREVFKRYNSGEAVNAIVDDLDRRSVPRERGGLWWAVNVVSILRCPTYTGTRYENVWSYVRKRRGKKYVTVKRTRNPESAWVKVGECPSIISQADWRSAQKRLDASIPVHRRKDGHAPDHAGPRARPARFLAGRLICGHCGARMVLGGRPGAAYYECPWSRPRSAKSGHKPTCTGAYIPAPAAESIVWQAVAAAFAKPSMAFRAFADGGGLLTEAKGLTNLAEAKETERQTNLRRWDNLIVLAAGEADAGHAAAIREKAATFHAKAKQLEAEANALMGQVEAKIAEHQAGMLHETNAHDLDVIGRKAAKRLNDLMVEQRAELVNVVLGDVKFRVQIIPPEMLKADYDVEPGNRKQGRRAEHRKLKVSVDRYQKLVGKAADLAEAFGLDNAEGYASRRAAALLLPSVQAAARTFAPCARNHAGAGWRLSAMGGVDPARLLADLTAFAKAL